MFAGLSAAQKKKLKAKLKKEADDKAGAQQEAAKPATGANDKKKTKNSALAEKIRLQQEEKAAIQREEQRLRDEEEAQIKAEEEREAAKEREKQAQSDAKKAEKQAKI